MTLESKTKEELMEIIRAKMDEVHNRNSEIMKLNNEVSWLKTMLEKVVNALNNS